MPPPSKAQILFYCRLAVSDRGAPWHFPILGYPRDPPVLKVLRRVNNFNFGTGSKFGTDVAKRYGKGSEVLVFLGKRGRKTVRIPKKTTVVAK